MQIADYLILVDHPALIMDRQGRLLALNAELQKLLPSLAAGQALGDALEVASVLAPILDRAVRTNAALPCALSFRTSAEPLKLRGRCRRLAGPDDRIVFALSFSQAQNDRFEALTNHIGQLNTEIARRQTVQHDLEQSLARNGLLLREIHHRVGNNLQIQMSMLEQQARHADDPEFRNLVERANDRLWALSQSLTFMYENGDWSHLDAAQLFGAVLAHLDHSFGDEVTIRFDPEYDWHIPNDMANTCALLLTELVTNAYQHGLRGRPGEIAVTLVRRGHEVMLDVRDPGAGYGEDDSKKGFGLLLVGRLCQLIGARFETGNERGSFARVIFKDQLAGATRDAA